MISVYLFIYLSIYSSISIYLSIYLSVYLSIIWTLTIQILLDQVEQYTSNNSNNNNSPHLNGSSIDYNPSSFTTTTTTSNLNPITIIDIINFKKRNGQPLRFGVSRPGSGSHTMAHYTAMLCGVQEFEIVTANNFDGLRSGR